jgi:hypothetical protein
MNTMARRQIPLIIASRPAGRAPAVLGAVD